ncbi:hypothetical protein ACTXPA_11640 [Glutamicibacter arilaitensis]|uniref:hypothetical protein n=1 Tax=Glutamicibacter arilaitensis TaxID=256701 RepID=UPI003FD131AC
MSSELERVSLKQLRHGSILADSDFTFAYGEFMVGHELEREKLVYLLSRAVLFLRSDDPNLNKLGYRIVLHYSLGTEDYEPLYEVAAAKDYAPILEVIESLDPLIVDRGFSSVLLSANRVNFVGSSGLRV